MSWRPIYSLPKGFVVGIQTGRPGQDGRYQRSGNPDILRQGEGAENPSRSRKNFFASFDPGSEESFC
ncbi:hypothetical protein LWI29_011775 [Acer saccharum]|uniref:Uncharacterized protein n=1 Tax=Acer saccharum TaxID=4024 RepID=A0AA39VXA3_ACESA|nr:hypothetical protein LWI29_011775 [Acer saccharum]KAK1547918.1 hypothetical protein Q3G72_002061 [Acer saccharum]